MTDLRLHRVEQGRFFLEKGEGLFSLWMIPWDDDSYVLFGSWHFSFHLNSFEVISLLLACFVEPIREKSCSLSLLPSFGTTQIEKNIIGSCAA